MSANPYYLEFKLEDVEVYPPMFYSVRIYKDKVRGRSAAQFLDTINCGRKMWLNHEKNEALEEVERNGYVVSECIGSVIECGSGKPRFKLVEE